MDNLENCPFCGGEATREEKLVVLENIPPNGATTFYTGCENRSCINPYSHWIDQEGADENWNTRASTTREAELQKEVERLKQVLTKIDDWVCNCRHYSTCNCVNDINVVAYQAIQEKPNV